MRAESHFSKKKMRQENDCFATRYIYRGIDSE